MNSVEQICHLYEDNGPHGKDAGVNETSDKKDMSYNLMKSMQEI